MPEETTQVCPVCGVRIVPAIAGDRVLFSSGPPGSRATLWARVCQYARKPGCINKNQDTIGEVKPGDYYQAEL